MTEQQQEFADDRLTELGLTTPELAQAKAIDNLSNPKGKANRTLSVLQKEDLDRHSYLSALYDVSGYGWIRNAQNNELDLRCSVNRKGQRGRDDLVKVTQQQDQQRGALGSFKENIKSFFSSGI